MPPFYSRDLAYIHDVGFGSFAADAAPQIVRLLRSRGIARGRIVEFGCGGGTMADALTSAGYGVLGIDASSAMIRLARARASRASFRVGTLRSAQIPACSAVIAIGEVVSYLTGNRAANERVHDAELAAFFARARRALRPCGLLVFDFIESAEGRTYAVKRMTGTDWAIRLRAAVNRSRGTLTRTIVTFRRDRAGYRQSRETHRLRIYPRADIRHLLAEAGFTTIFRRRIGTVRLMRGNVIAIAQQRARR